MARRTLDERIEEAKADFERWQRGDIVRIGDYTIQPSRDFGTKGTWDNHAWVVIKGGVAPLPGGTWSPTIDGSAALINFYEVALAIGGDDYVKVTKAFWGLVHGTMHYAGRLNEPHLWIAVAHRKYEDAKVNPMDRFKRYVSGDDASLSTSEALRLMLDRAIEDGV